MILLTWMIPLVATMLTYFLTSSEPVYMCIPGHADSAWANATAIIFFISILVIYILYGLILSKYWGLISRHRRVMEFQMRPSAVQKSLTKTTQNILRFLQNSKYIIFVVTSFIMCWIPGILLVFLDSGHHAVGRLDESK